MSDLTNAKNTSAAASAVTGLALWALQTYVFKDNPIPDNLSVLVYALVPAAVAWVSAHFTRAYTTPTQAATTGPAHTRILPSPTLRATQTPRPGIGHTGPEPGSHD